MRMAWKFDQGNPIYLQIIQVLESKILSGEYKPGDKLESVRDLASLAGVNPNTMQKALSEMEGMGLIYTQRTAGRFITEDAATIKNLRLATAQSKTDEFVGELNRLGYTTDEIIRIIKGEYKKEEAARAVSNLEDYLKGEQHEQ